MSLTDRRKKQAGIPPVPFDLPPAHRSFFAALRENLAVRMGQEGDPSERAVTRRELLDGSWNVGTGGGGSGLGSGGYFPPVGQTPALDYSPPPAPTGLQTSGGFNFIYLVWDNTAGYYPSYAEVYRSTVDALDLASPEMKLMGTAAGSQYVDYLQGERTVYYYWVRFVKVVGPTLVYGPFQGTAGVPGQLSLDPAYVVGLLEGQLAESELAAELLTPIQAIPSIQDTLIDHDSRIGSVQIAVNEVLNLPVFDSTLAYDLGDTVKFGGYAWRALVDTAAPSPTPVEGANWTQIGAYQTYSDLLSANALAIADNELRITTAEGQIFSSSTDISALQVDVADVEQGLSAQGIAISGIDTRVGLTEQGLTSVSADTTLLRNDVDAVEDGLSASSGALSLLDGRVELTESGLVAANSNIVQLQTDVSNLDVDGNAAALQELSTRVTTNTDDITAVAQDVTTLSASVGQNTAAVQTKAEAQVVTNLAGEVTGIKARYSIKLDVSGRMSGLVFGDNGTASSLVVASNSMLFIDPGQSITPFNPATDYTSMDALRDTQLVFGYAKVEGQNRFVINAPAYIPEGYITSGQVGAIGFGKIVDSNGQPVTTVAGKLLTQNIDVDNLRVGVAATFDGNAQSGNYSAGSAGWRLDAMSGTAEFNNVLARGQVDGSLITGSVIRGSVIEGSAFVAPTEAGSPYVGLASNLSWSSSTGTASGNHDRYFSSIDIASYNATPTSNYRRFRRRLVSARATLATQNADYQTVRFLVYNGAALVIDTGNRYIRTQIPASGSGWSLTTALEPYEYCYDGGCTGTVCDTAYRVIGVTFNLVNYSFSGNGQLRIRYIIGNGHSSISFSGSATATAYNDY